jgi:hypothetical protein
VHASFVCQVSHRKHLTDINAIIKFNNGNLNLPTKLGEQKKPARQLAKELIDFVEAHQVGQSEPLQFRYRDFNGYPKLESMLSWLRLSETDDAVCVFRRSLACYNITTGGIGVRLEYIKSAIKKKNKKATKYNWGDANEKWLLIAASSDIISNHAGRAMPKVNWEDPELLDLCCESLFDRIIFWEKVSCWYKWLKPSEKVVEFKR